MRPPLMERDFAVDAARLNVTYISLTIFVSATYALFHHNNTVVIIDLGSGSDKQHNT